MIRESTLKEMAHGWEQPTAAEVDELYGIMGISYDKIREITGARNTLIVQRWRSPRAERDIPYKAWMALCEYAEAHL